jgi:hypothetical protein
MSKKSRQRNKKILAAIGIGLGAAAMASKRKSDSASDVQANDNAFREKTKSTPTGPKELGISTRKKSTTIQDNKPTVFKPNKSAADDIMRGGSGTKYVDKYEGTPLKRLQKNSVGPSMSGIDDTRDFAAKSGGRAGYKHGGSTGSSKSYGAAKRGISPILMKGRK